MSRAFVDGMYYYYKAYFKFCQIFKSEWAAGFYGLVQTVMSLRKRFNNITIVWEGGSTIRKQQDVNYKASRRKMKGTFYDQLNDARIYLSKFVKQVIVREYEADDLLATLAYKSQPCTIVSGDDDLHQMLCKGIQIDNHYGTFSISNPKYRTDNKVILEWMFDGDKSDNIPSLKRKFKKELRLALIDNAKLEFFPTDDQLLKCYTKYFADVDIGCMLWNNLTLLQLKRVPDKNWKTLPVIDGKYLIDKYRCNSFKSHWR